MKMLIGALVTVTLLGGCATAGSRTDVSEEVGYNALVRHDVMRCDNVARLTTPQTNPDWRYENGKSDIDADFYRMAYRDCRRDGI